jgi:serine protease Do
MMNDMNRENRETDKDSRMNLPVPAGNADSSRRGRSRRDSRIGRRVKKAAIFMTGALAFGTIAGGAMVGVNVAARQAGITSSASAESSGSSASGSSSSSNSGIVNTTYSSTSSSNSGTMTVSEVTKKAMPSVVSITNKIKYQQNGYSAFGSSDNSQDAEESASGSGVIFAKTDSELLIVTNHHVVEDTSSLSVQFVDGTSVDASIKGEDADADLAVIAVNLSDISSDTLNQISVAEFGDSDSLEVGDQVVAIGNALGIGQSVTTGIISAKDKDISTSTGTESGLLQTDAAINPGNSGGALLNMQGQVIGINVAKYSSTEVEGMGYSIPSNKVKEIVNNLATKTTRSTTLDASEQGYLGVQVRTIDSSTSEAYNIPQGVYVTGLVSGGAAEQAGIQEKDIITAFDGQSVASADNLTDLISRYKSGETVTVTVERQSSGGGYEEKEIEVTLGKKPASSDSTGSSGSSDSSQGQVQQYGGIFGGLYPYMY